MRKSITLFTFFLASLSFGQEIPISASDLVGYWTLEQTVKENDIFFLFQVSATIQDGRSVGIGISGSDFNMVIDGVEADEDEGDFDLLAKGFYAESDSELGDLVDGESDGEAYVRITSIDKVNQVVSGEFHYLAIGDDGVTYNITEGLFNNISYTIL